MASAVSVHNTTREILSEEMHRLANQFNETVVLSVLLGHTGICADMAKSRHTLGLARERGYLVPLDQGASGKTLLAAQPPELRDSIIQEIGGDRTQQRLLKNQLLHILQTGYCISEGEVDPGIAAVAVPLVMKDRIYALSISGPLERLKALGYTQLADGLLLAAQRLGQKSALLSD